MCQVPGQSLSLWHLACAIRRLWGHPMLDIRNGAETFALICAGVFFLYKAYTGYLRVNLSVFLRCQRQHIDNLSDYLVTIMHLKKGENSSLTLHEVAARICL
jgi:hypothetical protein